MSPKPATCPYPEPDRSSACPHPTSRRCILILFSHLRLGLPSSLLPSVSPLKPCMHLSSPPYVPHVLPISVFLIWSPEWYLVRSTEHKTLCYAVFSTPLLPHPSWALFSNTLNLHSSPNARDQLSRLRWEHNTVSFISQQNAHHYNMCSYSLSTPTGFGVIGTYSGAHSQSHLKNSNPQQMVL